MSEWDGRGLPPVAAQRTRRAAEGGTWTSLMSVPAAVGIVSVGFEPVGEVMGSTVQRIGWTGFRGCGSYAGATTTSPQQRRSSGFAPYTDALNRGYVTALKRMKLEAAAIGGDGVTGVELTMRLVDSDVREFTALGTAVQARCSTRPERVFSTDLPGQDVATLVSSGWMPTDLVFGISVAICHDDARTRAQMTWRAGNVEVAGHSELINRARADARARFRRRVHDRGAEGAIVSSMSLGSWEIEPSDNHRDHVAEAAVFGTALAHFRTPTAASTRLLTFLPLQTSGGHP